MTYNSLRLILGDQLNENHSWFSKVDDKVLYVMMEIRPESLYAAHHIQKIIAFFTAMRAFVQKLRNKGHQVQYIKISDEDNLHSFEENLNKIISEYQISHFEFQEPDEYRLDQILSKLQLPIQSIKVFDSEHFLTKREDLKTFFHGKKQYLMENFYRDMRKKTGILMSGESPIGGKWNFDAENRKKLPKNHFIINPKLFKKDVGVVFNEIVQAKLPYIGEIDTEKFIWPTSREESLELLLFFCNQCLPNFGNFQDAMAEKYWSLYHSRLSFAMNVKMLHPMEVIEAGIGAFEKNKSQISLPQIEGFVRQILGWREYMRGVYWAQMPNYAQLNFFNHKNKLPSWYWSGKTKMNCLHHSITQSLEYAYTHHIQRLMITGNFALLAGVNPDEVDAWYLGIYIDAIEWVEITNTRGMSQFADGGIVGTKPYVSSAAYIDKMSDYCTSCFYDKKKKVGERSCPFNSFYWNFIAENRELLEKNPRMTMMYKLWDKMDNNLKNSYLNQAKHYLNRIELI